MGTACCSGYSASERITGIRSTYSLKRMKSPKLVGVPQTAVDPDARAREEFPAADIDKNGAISFDEVKILMKRLNAYMSKKKLRHIFDEVDINKDGQLNLQEFQQLFIKADERPTMLRLFHEADQLVNGHITALNLHEFLKTTAPDDPLSGWKVPSEAECAKLMGRYFKGTRKGDVMLFENFRRYLCDPEENNICDPGKLFKVYQDMDRPLSHYYISSSHNSYLEGTQTHGVSTPNALKRALELGVRVIELDAWDGSSEPIVNHGHTFCKPTTFKACIDAVNKYAFSATEYPLILTIENHCTKPFQQKMAKILETVLGDKLYRFQDGSVVREKLFRGPDEWASPRELMGKVVIRDKPKKTKKDIKALKSKPGQDDEKEDGSRPKLNDMKQDSDLANSVSIDLNSERSMKMKTKKKSGLVKTLFLRKAKQAPTDLVNSDSNDDSGRTLNKSTDPNVSDSSLNPRRQTKGEKSGANGMGERKGSNQSQNAYDEEEDEEEDFVDDRVENEGLGDQVAQEIQDKKRELRRDIQLTMAGSVRFAAGKLGFLNEKDPGAVREFLKVEPVKDLPTNSVAQFLELVYIKNVKLRVREDRAKRPSMKTREDLATSIARLEDYKAIHFTYPDWRSSSSIVEGKMMRLTRPGARCAALATYANYHLIRSYPAGTRVESSNYDPCPAWNAGIHVVALNYQTNGKPIWLNQGKFSDNGACGYVLKPQAMLEARSCGRDTPEEESPEEEQKQYWDLIPKPTDPRGDRMKITIISAHFLPKPISVDEAKGDVIDPFVEIHVCGYDKDDSMQKTKHVDDNGFNPEFDETFTFVLRRAELDLLMFVVKDKTTFGEEFIAQNCFPMKLVRPGYRVVPLRRQDSSPIPDAFIFVHVSFEREVVPLE